MKILHIINSLETGGAQRMVSELTDDQSRIEGLDTGILTFQDSKGSDFIRKAESNRKIATYRLYGNPWSPGTIKEIRRIAGDYDLVHSHLFPSGYLTALAFPSGKKPLVYTEHSTYNRRRAKKYLRVPERFVYSRYSAICAISEPVKEALAQWLDSPKIESRIRVISNGVNLADFMGGVAGKSKDLFGREGKPIIMISRFTDSKDHESAIRSIPLITDEEAFMVFVGEGEKLPEMKRLAEDLGVADRCVFLGNREDVPALIHGAHIGLQASNWEGFGLTAVEMMAGGLPVIASDVSGLNEVARDAGILYQPKDINGLAAAINSLLSDKSLRESLRDKSRKRAAQYDIGKTSEEYLKLYSDLTGRDPRD